MLAVLLLSLSPLINSCFRYSLEFWFTLWVYAKPIIKNKQTNKWCLLSFLWTWIDQECSTSVQPTIFNSESIFLINMYYLHKVLYYRKENYSGKSYEFKSGGIYGPDVWLLNSSFNVNDMKRQFQKLLGEIMWDKLRTTVELRRGHFREIKMFWEHLWGNIWRRGGWVKCKASTVFPSLLLWYTKHGIQISLCQSRKKSL